MSERLSPLPLFAFVSAEGNTSHIARTLGISRGMVNYWRKTNRVQLYTADRLCCQRLKVHPAEVWPDWFERVAHD